MVGLVAVSLGAGLLGNVATPMLLRESPVALLAVVSGYAQMALARPRVDPTTLIVVAAVRRCLGEVIPFAAGRVIGGDAVRWYARRTGMQVRLPREIDGRWAWLRDLAVVVVPHPLLAALFGLTAIPARRYIALKLLGSLLTVAVFWWLAGTTGGTLDTAAAAVEGNAVALTGVLALGALLWLALQRRR